MSGRRIPEMKDDNGHEYYLNGGLKWIVTSVIVAMWGLLVLLGSGFAKDALQKIDENRKDIVDIKVSFARIEQRLETNKDEVVQEITKEIRRALKGRVEND